MIFDDTENKVKLPNHFERFSVFGKALPQKLIKIVTLI